MPIGVREMRMAGRLVKEPVFHFITGIYSVHTAKRFNSRDVCETILYIVEPKNV